VILVLKHKFNSEKAMTKQQTTHDKAKTTGGLEMILHRNAFYHDAYRRVLSVLFLLAIVNCILIAGITYKITHPELPQYFPMTADGRLINQNPLSDPAVTDDFVLQWSSNVLRKSFSLDYIHWRDQLQSASNSFTPQGWRYFLQALKGSNNLDTLTSLKMVSDAQITGAPQILEKEVLNGVYAWKIQVPILVNYSNVARTIQMPMEVTLIVLRVPVQQNPDRIAINNILPVVQKTTDQQLLQGG
jgi:intracellular multiplication protein IcmL